MPVSSMLALWNFCLNASSINIKVSRHSGLYSHSELLGTPIDQCKHLFSQEGEEEMSYDS